MKAVGKFSRIYIYTTVDDESKSPSQEKEFKVEVVSGVWWMGRCREISRNRGGLPDTGDFNMI